MLVEAEQQRQDLMAELEGVRAESRAVHEASRQAMAAAVARAEAAEQAQETATGKLGAAETAAAQARAEAGRFQQAPGLRGWVVRWLVR